MILCTDLKLKKPSLDINFQLEHWISFPIFVSPYFTVLNGLMSALAQVEGKVIKLISFASSWINRKGGGLWRDLDTIPDLDYH